MFFVRRSAAVHGKWGKGRDVPGRSPEEVLNRALGRSIFIKKNPKGKVVDRLNARKSAGAQPGTSASIEPSDGRNEKGEMAGRGWTKGGGGGSKKSGSPTLETR